MYKILVADDEPMHRRGIAGMIRKLRPGYALFEARDGEEALQIMNSREIDIVITDIKMPNLDGLQLIERLGSRIKTVKVVILSAYGYFEYAKKAITLGAFDYVLKPVVERDIVDTLVKLEESMEKDRKIIQERASLEKRLSHTLPVYLDHLLTKWVGGGLTKAESEEIEKLIPVQSKCVVLLSEMNKREASGLLPSGEASDEAELALKYGIGDHMKPLGNSISFFLGGQGKRLVTVLYADRNEAFETNSINECVNQFIAYMQSLYGVEVSVGISRTFDDPFEEIHMSCEQAGSALLYQFYYGPGRALFYEQIPLNENKMPFPHYAQEEELHEAIIQLNRDQAADIADMLCQAMIAEGYPPPRRLTQNIVYLVLNQIKRSEHLLPKEQFKSLIDQAGIVLSGSGQFEELKSKVMEIILFMIAHIENRKNNKNSAIIQKCKEYIEENFMDDLQLDTVAKMFYFSPAYFSSFFKNYTGMSFSEFILKARIRKAKELLIHTDEKVYDIAFQVGYRDPGYFTKMFKRETGLAPEDFRRNNGISMRTGDL